MLASVRRLEHEFDAALSQVDALKGLRRGTVRIGVLQFAIERFVPAVVADVHAAYPGLSFTIHTGNSDDIARRVADGTLDIGLCWAPPASVPLSRVRLANVPIGLAVRPDHPLAARHSIRLRECMELPLILPTADMELRRMLDNVQSGAVARITPLLETNSMALMRRLVGEGIGAAIMTRITVLSDIREGRLVLVPLSDPGSKSMAFGLLAHSERSPSIAAALVLQMLEERFKELSGAA